MVHKAIPDSERYIIVDGDGFGGLTEVTRNLNDNELVITVLEAEDCPIAQCCVSIVGPGITSICKYTVPYSGPSGVARSGAVSGEIPCTHKRSLGSVAVRNVAVENCPLGESNCLDCQHLKDIVIPPDSHPEKSHAHIVCGKVQAKGV